MEKKVTPILTDVYDRIKVGQKLVDKIEYIASDGKPFDSELACERYEKSLEHEKLIADITMQYVETYEIDVPSRYYFCDTTDKLLRLCKYFDYKENYLKEHDLVDDKMQLTKPTWIGVEHHDGGDYPDWYSITTWDEIKQDYQRLVNVFEGEEDGIE